MAAAPTPEHAMESALPTDAAPPGVLQPPAAQAAEPQLLQALIGPSLYLGVQFSTTSNLLDLCFSLNLLIAAAGQRSLETGRQELSLVTFGAHSLRESLCGRSWIGGGSEDDLSGALSDSVAAAAAAEEDGSSPSVMDEVVAFSSRDAWRSLLTQNHIWYLLSQGRSLHVLLLSQSPAAALCALNGWDAKPRAVAVAIALDLARRVGFVIVYLPTSLRLTLQTDKFEDSVVEESSSRRGHGLYPFWVFVRDDGALFLAASTGKSIASNSKADGASGSRHSPRVHKFQDGHCIESPPCKADVPPICLVAFHKNFCKSEVLFVALLRVARQLPSDRSFVSRLLAVCPALVMPGHPTLFLGYSWP
eukprot:s4218_g3.t1